ncbi:phosphopantetheine adenylyltransferase [Methylibium sp. Pch-M]|uniref:photosynthetic complex putative assembly protein PuhB n=1 Tax=Methylibium sp. Pch-M TaxID=2082386 RepID=UPI001013B40C|nr:photosynthetic complex putative assembly protein PuhB [Methylibium sp. Pch-M]QAZ38567.1 phosphopantetheine adenylyltransferase [Methylibium sp. Pch-M]
MSDDHDFEPAYGLPELLPAGERLLWQGAPQWRVLAREALHVRKLAAYFGVLLVWRAGVVLGDGGGLTAVALSWLWMLPLAALALGLLTTLAWLIGRTSVYSVTDRRVVMRIGIVLTITFNLPYRTIEAAGLRTHPDGSGDITLTLAPAERIAYLHLWPHARPWKVARTEPMLRALPDARHVAQLLSDALTASAGVAPAAMPAADAAGRPRANDPPGHALAA